MDSPDSANITAEKTTAATRLQNTKNTEKLNSTPAYGIVMIRSCNTPYSASITMMPAA